MRAGMTVAADNRHSGLGEPLFGSDDMDDSLIFGAQSKERYTEITTICFELG